MNTILRECGHKRKLILGRMKGALLVLALLLVPPALTQTPSKPDVWEPLKYFIGSWEGMSNMILPKNWTSE